MQEDFRAQESRMLANFHKNREQNKKTTTKQTIPLNSEEKQPTIQLYKALLQERLTQEPAFWTYTPARKVDIHKCLFPETVSRKTNYISVTQHFLGLTPRKLHYMYSFVIQRIMWNNYLGIVVLDNLISVTQNNLFGVKLARTYGLSVLGARFGGTLAVNLSSIWYPRRDIDSNAESVVSDGAINLGSRAGPSLPKPFVGRPPFLHYISGWCICALLLCLSSSHLILSLSLSVSLSLR